MRQKGFSLVELIIIIIVAGCIITILYLVINPTKILQKSRDAQRFQDMSTLSAALNRYLSDGRDYSGLTGPYTSIDAGFNSDKARTKIDGTGWIPLNFSAISQDMPMTILPIDPLNNAYHKYRFGLNVTNRTYELEAVFERPENAPKATNDNGNNPNAYEIGTDLTIL